jgi:eukaryotic-like serine/threonine-protein kinase
MESPPKTPAEGTFGQAAPERLGKYPLLSVIGTGSMGVVYKSFDPELSRAIALKTIRRELLDDEIENFPARFRIEAQTAGALIHPGIACVYEYGEAEGYAYIAMEYVEGHSLGDCFERKVRFNTDQSINILAQLLKALQYAHEHGVWHRDVKPANILLMGDGQVKVTDFGIARVESLNLAQVDAIMGTPGVIAPETYLGEGCDHRIDLFAAGVVFYQLLAGVPPFVGTPEKIMFKVCYESPLPASVVARQPSLRPFDSVVLKALARRPEDRFSSAAEFLEALLLAQTGGPVVGADQTVLVSRRPQQTAQQTGQQTKKTARIDETVLVARRLQRASIPPGADETQIVSRRAVPDDANLTLIRPFPAEGPITTDSPVTEPLRSSQALEPVADSEPPNQPQPTNTQSLAPGWNPEDLARIEKHLARFVGPIARVLVRNASRETGDLVSLVQTVAEKIRSSPDREAFLRVTGAGVASAFTARRSDSDAESHGARSGGGTPLTPEYVARASQLLAVHLGPIAKVLATRAAQSGSSQEQFVAALAARLSDDRERARFLKALP